MEDFSKMISDSEGLFMYIKKFAIKGGKETTKVLLELYFVMISPQTSKVDKILIGAALAYNTVPKDFLPMSKLGLLGFFDNIATLTFAYNKVKKTVTPEISIKVNNLLTKWFNDSSTSGDIINAEEVEW